MCQDVLEPLLSYYSYGLLRSDASDSQVRGVANGVVLDGGDGM